MEDLFNIRIIRRVISVELPGIKGYTAIGCRYKIRVYGGVFKTLAVMDTSSDDLMSAIDEKYASYTSNEYRSGIHARIVKGEVVSGVIDIVPEITQLEEFDFQMKQALAYVQDCNNLVRNMSGVCSKLLLALNEAEFFYEYKGVKGCTLSLKNLGGLDAWYGNDKGFLKPSVEEALKKVLNVFAYEEGLDLDFYASENAVLHIDITPQKLKV